MQTPNPSHKPWLKILTAVIAITLCFLFVISTLFERRVQQRFTEQLSAIVGVEIQIETVDILWTKNRIEIRRLSVGNPKDFVQPSAFEAERVVVDIALSSLFGDQLDINQVQFYQSRINYEAQTEADNYSVIAETVSRYSAPVDIKTTLIDKLVFEQGSLSFEHPFLLSPETLPLLQRVSSTAVPITSTNVPYAIEQILHELMTAIEYSVATSGLMERAQVRIQQQQQMTELHMENALNQRINETLDAKIQQQLDDMGIKTDDGELLRNLLDDIE